MPAGPASERRAAPRTAVVWDDLDPLLAGHRLSVLDIGGGTGVSAVRIAAAGHRVCVVDPSPDALAALARRARELGVEVEGRQGDVADLPTLFPDAARAASEVAEVADGAVERGGFDLVLCHGVLEVVTDPGAALAAIRAVLRPGGTLSLLLAQRHAAVVARALAGHFAQATALLSAGAAGAAGAGVAGPEGARSSRAGRRFTLAEVTDLLAGAGLEAVSMRGIRVFADLVPGAALDLEPGAPAALVELERAVAPLPEYLPLATQLHALAR